MRSVLTVAPRRQSPITDRQSLVVVEFNTPQLATDNNRRITAKIQELRNQGQPLPSAYRRVGNYAVFVFDAPSEEAANQLIDQVKYQQVVQWLGENPFAYETGHARIHRNDAGRFCFCGEGIGFSAGRLSGCRRIFGALLFTSTASAAASREAYADAGAMLRLNLDELTPEI